VGKDKPEGAETGSGATAASVDFPDPFPPLPQQPYGADDSAAPESNTDPLIPATAFHDADPATDPAMPVLDPYDQQFEVVTGPQQIDKEIGAATGIELLRHHRFLAAAEPVRRGGGSAMVVRP